MDQKKDREREEQRMWQQSLTGNSSGRPNLPQPKPVENKPVGGEHGCRDYFVLTRYPREVYLHRRSVMRLLSMIRYRTYFPEFEW